MIWTKVTFLIAILLGLKLTHSQKTRYDGYRLVQVVPTKEEHVRLFDEWEEDPSFDIWNRVKSLNIGVDVALSPESFEIYKVLFEQNNMPYKILNDNLQKTIDEEELSMKLDRLRNGHRVAGKYVSHTDINIWLEQIKTANPTYLTTQDIGTTPGGKTMKVIIFNTGNTEKSIWFDCGIHAREWISPATCTYMINKLTVEYNNKNTDVVNLLNKYTIYFLPVHNPDGYDYSRTNTRLWRKSRSTTSSTICPGVDLNRNYGYQWNTGGASSSACSDTYAGPSANSEPETKAVQNVINSKPSSQWAAFVTIHSYGQWFLTPYGNTYSLPPDYADQLKLAQDTSNVIKSVYGMQFTSGSTSGLLYIASGNSADWAYGTVGIKYSYTIELRPGSGTADASYGFQLPEDRAPYVGEETYQGMIYFMKNL